jgi:sialic acid synthase SpsE
VRTKIIAEVSSNHGGDINLAREFVRVAAEIGVDFVKFQSWQAKKLRRDDSQLEWFTKSELTDKAHYILLEECERRGIEFLTTCFDIERIDFLSKLGLKRIKIASPDAASFKMLKEIKKRFQHIILSTGMTYSEELRRTAELLREVNFTFLHCVSIYPTPIEKVNMKRMEWLRKFTPSVGYSDHTVGIEAVKLAIVKGAEYVEKHFCLGKHGPGRVMPWDATPDEMEKIVEYSLMCVKMEGEGSYEPYEEEEKARERFIGRFGDNR